MLSICFILFHAGETRALLPTINNLIANHEKVLIIPVGISAKKLLPKNLNKYTKTPCLINDGLGQNDEYALRFRDSVILEIISFCKNSNLIITGSPSKIQEQIVKNLPPDKKIIVYFDLFATYAKVLAFQQYAYAFIVTLNSTKIAIKKHLQSSKIKHQPKIILARHGDFDIWVENSKRALANEDVVSKELELNKKHKFILWAGGYDDLSINDKERKAFLKFIKSFYLYKNQYQLRVTIHPGLKNYIPGKLQRILDFYYLDTLREFKFTNDEIKSTITDLNASNIAIIATAVVSLCSTASIQAAYLNINTKNIYLTKDLVIPSIESVKSSKRWCELFKLWVETPYSDEINQDIPKLSTYDAIKNLHKEIF
jgi:hypothetical protein